MKTWRQKQTGQFEVFLIRAVLSEDDEVTIEYHEVNTELWDQYHSNHQKKSNNWNHPAHKKSYQ